MKEPSYPEDLSMSSSEILKENNPASRVSALTSGETVEIRSLHKNLI